MAFGLKTAIFGMLSISSTIVFAAGPSLGNLEKPLESLGAITKFAENVQKRTPSELGKLVDENDCERKITLPDESEELKAGDMKVPQFLVEISGPGCPVTYTMSLKGQQKADGFLAELHFKYAAQSAEAKALYDVDQYELNGVLNATVLQSRGGGGIDFNFVYGGKGNSQSEGPFASDSTFGGKFLVSMGAGGGGASGGLFNLKIDGQFENSSKIAFKSDQLDLKSVIKMSGFFPEASFEVNGNKVTEAEYNRIYELVKLPGMDANPNGGNSGGAATMLECTASVYRSTGFSATSKPLKVSRSCGVPSVDVGQIDGLSYSAQFNVFPDYTSVQVQMCEGGSKCESAERAFVPSEAAIYIDELLSRFKIEMSCSPVVACNP